MRLNYCSYSYPLYNFHISTTVLLVTGYNNKTYQYVLQKSKVMPYCKKFTRLMKLYDSTKSVPSYKPCVSKWSEVSQNV